MYIFTTRLSQVSDITSPGIKSQDIFSSPSSSFQNSMSHTSSRLLMSSNEKPDATDNSKNHHSRKQYKVDAANLQDKSDPHGKEDDPPDEDDGSYHPEKDSPRNLKDDLLYDSSNSDDESSKSEILGQPPPKLSDAEKPRAQLKSSTARDERKRKISSVSSSKSGSKITFKARMIELQHANIQEKVNDFPFAKGNALQDAKGIMKCIPCGKEVDFVKISTLQNHINSTSHKRKVESYIKNTIPLKSSMRHFLIEKEKAAEQQGVGTKTSIDSQELRMRLCYALLSDGLPFKFLETKNPHGLGAFLRTIAHVNVSYRKIVDMIPGVLTLEMDSVSADVDRAKYMSIIFDATPDRGEAFAVVIRYVDDMFVVHHRCISLTFYEKSFDSQALGT